MTTGEPGLLWKLMGALVLMAAFGAFLNMVPYFFYDFTERRQKAVITVLKLRAMFEDYANDALPDDRLKEGIEIIRSAERLLRIRRKPIPRREARRRRPSVRLRTITISRSS